MGCHRPEAATIRREGRRSRIRPVGFIVADPLKLAGSRGPLARLTCAPAAPRVHQAELPGASRQAALSPVFTRAVHPVHCRAEAFPSGRRPLMNDIGANEALGPLRTRSARPCGSQTESGPNVEHWKTVCNVLARALAARLTPIHAACSSYTYAHVHGKPGVHAA
jgi:hypothetical protein